MQKICTLVPSNSFESPQINGCLTMWTYHYGFGPEDERLEDPIVDKVQGSKGLRQLGSRRAKQSHSDSIKT
jgi:hypothetical protein